MLTENCYENGQLLINCIQWLPEAWYKISTLFCRSISLIYTDHVIGLNKKYFACQWTQFFRMGERLWNVLKAILESILFYHFVLSCIISISPLIHLQEITIWILYANTCSYFDTVNLVGRRQRQILQIKSKYKLEEKTTSI